MEDRRCRATARSGERCKRYAIPGGRTCVSHGGAAPQVRAAAARRRAEAEARALVELWDPAASPITDPIGSLQNLAGRLQHAADVLGARLESADLEGGTARAWVAVIRELRQALEGMERLDLAGKSLELDRQLAEAIVVAFRGALERLRLTPTDRMVVTAEFLGALPVNDEDRPFVEALGTASERTLTTGAEAIAMVVKAALDRLDLTDEQWATAEQVLPEELRRLGAGDAEAFEVVRGELE